MKITRPFLLLACWMPAVEPTPVASGHTLLLSRGEVLLHDDRVIVEIQINGEDFLHHYDLSIDPEGLVSAPEFAAVAQKNEAVLDEALIIRNQWGERLHSEGFRLDPHWSASTPRLSLKNANPRYRATFEMPDKASLLAFQLLPSMSRASTAWQVALRIRETSPGARTLLLTDRGNVDILPLDWHSGYSVAGDSVQGERQCPNCDRRGTEQLEEVCADIEIGENQLSVECQIPLPILAGFKGIALGPHDFLSAPEQTAVLAAARGLLAGAVEVSVAGALLDGELAAVELVNLFDPPKGKPGPQPVSYWLGGVRTRIEFKSDSPLDRAAIRWRLFNNAVLTAQASIRFGNRCIELEFSTYAPEYEWVSR